MSAQTKSEKSEDCAGWSMPPACLLPLSPVSVDVIQVCKLCSVILRGFFLSFYTSPCGWQQCSCRKNSLCSAFCTRWKPQHNRCCVKQTHRNLKCSTLFSSLCMWKGRGAPQLPELSSDLSLVSLVLRIMFFFQTPPRLVMPCRLSCCFFDICPTMVMSTANLTAVL